MYRLFRSAIGIGTFMALHAMMRLLKIPKGKGVATAGAATLDDVRRAPERLVALGEEMEAERATAKKFLYESFYNSPGMEESHQHAAEVVAGLFEALMKNPTLLPEDHQTQIPTEGLARTVADYIAGMTDSYIEQFWQQVVRA